MYACTFRLLSDDEIGVVSVFLEDQGSKAYYELRDTTGQLHSWQLDMSWDTDSESYKDRAGAAVVSYLCDCQTRGWNGRVELVQSAMGIPMSYWHMLLSKFDALHATTKPDWMLLQ